MLKFGLTNLRRLRSVSPIELKPITLLVGRNSSGKSTFLRTFPLLRQSLMTRTSSPILWYGDLVDFGTFESAISAGALTEPISFSFELDLFYPDPRMIWRADRYEQADRTFRDVRYEVTIGLEGERVQIRSLSVSIQEPKVTYEILLGAAQKVSRFLVNGVDLVGSIGQTEFVVSQGTIFPEMHAVAPEGTSPDLRRPRRRMDAEFATPIHNFIKSELKRTDNAALTRMIDVMLEGAPVNAQEILTLLQTIDLPISRPVRRVLENASAPDAPKRFEVFQNLLAAAALPALLAQIAAQLRAIVTSTLYIGPARARSERYYRYQDLSVSEIDPDGKNFAMFLNSLSNYQIDRLSNWVSGLFGFGVSVTKQSGHISINLHGSGGTDHVNIVDTGYGVSQILPVLGQIWWARTRSVQQRYRGPRISLLAIEQPELHLHPAHQALLADAFVGEVGLSPERRPPGAATINFLVETHSETLVNRLGELIAYGRLNPSDVQIVLFDAPEDDNRETRTRTSHFNSSGELVNWPYGFFQPTVK
jgi:hypothetical protein